MSYHRKHRRGMGDTIGGAIMSTQPGIVAATGGAGSGGSSWTDGGSLTSGGSAVGNIASAISSLLGRSMTPPVYAQPTGPSTMTILLVGGIGLAALYFIATKD